VHVRPGPTALVDTTQLRRTLGTFATGVTVVTVGGSTPRGMTANSFTSVSLDPPLVLVCVERSAVMHDLMAGCAGFGISVLAADQEAIARHFADRRRPPGHEQFDVIDWLPGPLSGAPLIAGAAARLECAPWRTYDGGDHSVFLGELLSVQHRPEADVLLFLSGRFRRLEVDADPSNRLNHLAQGGTE
jgi:flavin reductase (DIM6/NTAB) family NADH-FMN oxidoreductase RutF